MTTTYLRSGIFLAPFHNLRENPTLALERDFELLQHLDRLGYNEAWIGEHHSGGFEIIASPEVFIAAAAERTRHIRLGTGVASLPYHNPFILADRMVLLDHITRGRAMFGVGPGALVHDAAKIGILAGDQRRMMHESLDVIVRLLHGETVTEKTDWYNLQDARLQLPCYTQPVMELAVAASRSPTGALASGRHGIGMLSIGGTSPDAMKHHAKNWGLYEEQARQHNKTADRRNWRLVTLLHVAETREQARETSASASKPSPSISATSPPSPSSPPESAMPMNGCWKTRPPVSAPRTTRSPTSKPCSKAPAASAPSWSSPTTGPTGTPPSATTSSWPAMSTRISRPAAPSATPATTSPPTTPTASAPNPRPPCKPQSTATTHRRNHLSRTAGEVGSRSEPGEGAPCNRWFHSSSSSSSTSSLPARSRPPSSPLPPSPPWPPPRTT